MPSPPAPSATASALVVLLVVSSTAGLLAYSMVRPSPACPTRIAAPSCPAVPLTLRYDSQTAEISENGSGSGPVTELRFEGVQFSLWLTELSGYLRFVQGTASEPGGPALAFAVFSTNTSFAGTAPTNASSSAWFSPDGVFGVAWVGGSALLVTVRLYVADPIPHYGTENVTLAQGANGVVASARLRFLGVVFQLGASDLPPPEGPMRNATAELPNGTLYDLSLWAGPRTACQTFYGSSDRLGTASCLESVSPGYEVGIVWTGELNAMLLVGTP